MRPGAALGLALLLLPGAVLAHSPIKGLDAFYGGVLHPLFVPAHVMSIVAFGVLIGQQGAESLQSALIAFLFATAGGLVLAGLSVDVPVQMPLLLLAALSGVLVALAHPLPAAVPVLLAVALGVLLGLDSTQDELAGRSRWGALLGSGMAIYLLALYAMVFAEWFRRHAWQRLGLRVLGSWMAASAILVLALLFAA